jgi:GT2 family glycosyltransferase
MLKKNFPECTLIVNKRNIGFVKANNLAIQHAKGSYVLYLNPDTKLITNPIFKMADFLENNKSYGAIGCKLILPDGQTQYICARTFPTPFNQFCFLSMLDRLFPKSKLFSSVEVKYWDHNDDREVECLSGANLMVRKDIVDQLNGFDPNIFMYAEDVDLCYRIKKLGWKIYYLSDEIIMHYAGSSSKKQNKIHFSAIMQRESNLYFQKKHFGKAKGSQYLLAVFAGSLIRILSIIVLTPFLFCSKKLRSKVNPQSIVKYITLLKWSVSVKNL